MKRMIYTLLLAVVGSGIAFSQLSIKGKILDKNKEAIIGATVLIKGTSVGTITDLDGNFVLNDVPKNALIAVSYIGYQTQELKPSPMMMITLNDSQVQLNELMVIGYGSVKKKDATGSVVAIKAEELNKGVATAPQQLIQGKIAGVLVTPGDGGPGSSASIRIRGEASLNASNDPLIVIDGIPVEGGTMPGMSNPLSTINPNNIETFTVLKDASATAIYGSRASNGVILITTKKGGGDRPTVSYNSTFSAYANTKQLDMLSAGEFRNFIREKHPDKVSMMGQSDTDWRKEVMRLGLGTDQNVSLQGTLAKFMPYRATVGYTNESGTIRTSNFERLTGDVSLSPKFFDNHLSVNLNAKYVHNANRLADGGVVGGAAFFDPTQPVFQSYPGNRFNGYYTWLSGDLPNTIAGDNPVALIDQRDNRSTVGRFIGNVQVDYKMHFLPELRLNINAGMDESNIGERDAVAVNSIQAWKDNQFRGEGRYTDKKNYRLNRLLEIYGSYAKEIEQHQFDVMAGYSWQHFYRSGETDVYSNEKNTFFSSVPFKSENYLVSFFGRANYIFDSRYMLTASLRSDGSSRFGRANRWGLFPSAAMAWNISNEDFLSHSNVVSNLKLRLGWGETGQQELNDNFYPSLARYNLSTDNANNYFLGDAYYAVLKPDAYDENIKWETTTTWNAGLDFGFLNNRFSGSVDVYYRNTRDLLNTISIPTGSNFSNVLTTNIGNMVNQGVELALNGELIRTKDFSWNLAVNGTFQSTRLVKLTAIGTSMGVEVGGISGGKGNRIQMHQEGHSPYTFYTFEQRYNSDGTPAQNQFVDRDNDGEITEGDRYMTGKSPSPDFFYGINWLMKYKNWDFGFNLRGSVGNYAYNDFLASNSTSNIAYAAGFLVNVAQTAFKYGFNDLNSGQQYRSDLFVENASFLKMDNITLGYNFRNIAKSNVNLRLYASAQNVFTITPYSGLDPEGTGIDNNIWPRPFIATFGINLSF